MKFEDMTIKDIKLLQSFIGNSSQDDCLWEVGKNYFIRTVTMHLVGKLEKVTDKELLLSKCTWVADDGRFNNALKTGEFDETEPFINDVIVGRASIIDATKWDHSINFGVK